METGPATRQPTFTGRKNPDDISPLGAKCRRSRVRWSTIASSSPQSRPLLHSRVHRSTVARPLLHSFAYCLAHCSTVSSTGPQSRPSVHSRIHCPLVHSHVHRSTVASTCPKSRLPVHSRVHSHIHMSTAPLTDLSPSHLSQQIAQNTIRNMPNRLKLPGQSQAQPATGIKVPGQQVAASREPVTLHVCERF